MTFTSENFVIFSTFSSNFPKRHCNFEYNMCVLSATVCGMLTSGAAWSSLKIFLGKVVRFAYEGDLNALPKLIASNNKAR